MITEGLLAIPTAFASGIATFFATCLLPLVPTYLAFLAGLSGQDKHITVSRWLLIRYAVFFVAGFVGMFVILGMAMRGAVYFLPFHRIWLTRIVGFFFILFGLLILNVFKPGFLLQERRWNVLAYLQKIRTRTSTGFLSHVLQNKSLQAVLFGVGFGLGWSPCIGPVLASILFMVARAGTHLQGIFLLFVYGLGLGVPFLVVAALYDRIDELIKRSPMVSTVFNWLAGGLLILMGLLMVTNSFGRLSLFLIDLLEMRHLIF